MLEFCYSGKHLHTFTVHRIGSVREKAGMRLPKHVLWMLDFLSLSTEYESLLSSLGFLPLFSLLEQFSVYLYFKLCSSFCDRLRFSHLCFHFLLVFENLGILIHKSCFPWASSKLFLRSRSGFSWVLILFPFQYEVNNKIVHPFVYCFALLLHNLKKKIQRLKQRSHWFLNRQFLLWWFVVVVWSLTTLTIHH